MPIEIKELHIRVNVTPSQSSNGGGSTAALQGVGGRISAKVKQEIIAECIEQVMKILENKKER
ncbi:hypothetical protein MASR1M74_00680 [Lentimicrobium sp.]